MTKRSYPLSKVYTLLEPGPVVLLTTAHKGRMNVMSQSWHTMMEFEPPLVSRIVSGNNFSFETLRTTREWSTATTSSYWKSSRPGSTPTAANPAPATTAAAAYS